VTPPVPRAQLQIDADPSATRSLIAWRRFCAKALEQDASEFTTYDERSGADLFIVCLAERRARGIRTHVWMAPCLQGFSAFGVAIACGHVSGLLTRRMAAGPHGFR